MPSRPRNLADFKLNLRCSTNRSSLGFKPSATSVETVQMLRTSGITGYRMAEDRSAIGVCSGTSVSNLTEPRAQSSKAKVDLRV